MSILDLGSDIVQEEERDTLGGFQPFESDLYEMVIKTAFLDKAASGANNITVLFETPEGKKFKLVEYITSAAGKNYYIDKKDGKTKRPLPGMSKMNGLSNLVKGTDLGQQILEDKVHKIWDSSQSKEVPQSRKTFTEWTDQTIHVGMLKILENKSVKNTAWKEGDPKKDKYVATAETRETNVVDKFFNEDKATLAEVNAGTPAAFYKDWVLANQGKVRDKTDKSLKAGAPSIAGGESTEPLTFDE